MSLGYYRALMGGGQVEGNFLTPYLGSELAFVGGFFRRNPSYTGIVAKLRRLSDGATHDLYFNGENEVDWSDSTLLTFVSGAEVEVIEIYNQFPSANWLTEKVAAPNGRGATLYEGGSFNTLTGKIQKAMIFNGSDEYYISTFTISARKLAYIGAVGEAGSTNANNNAVSLGRSDSQSDTFRLLIRSNNQVGQTITGGEVRTAAGGSATLNTPHLVAFSDNDTNRYLYEDESQVATESFTLTQNVDTNALLIGQYRGGLPSGNYFNGKLSEVWAFFDSKSTERGDIESTINLDYSL